MTFLISTNKSEHVYSVMRCYPSILFVYERAVVGVSFVGHKGADNMQGGVGAARTINSGPKLSAVILALVAHFGSIFCFSSQISTYSCICKSNMRVILWKSKLIFSA